MAKKDKGMLAGEPVTYQIPDPAGGVKLETFIPWSLVKRGVKREVITPLDKPEAFVVQAAGDQRTHKMAQDTPLMRALGLAHYWQRLLNQGRMASVTEIARAEGIDVTQVRRLIRLALLAPEIVEKLSTSKVLLEPVIRHPWPNIWEEQVQMAISTPSIGLFQI